MVSDAELLAAWRAGDHEAGNALVKQHFAAVYRFFRNKMEGDLDDLVQLTFMKCAQAKDAVREDGSFRAYLFAVARNVLKDYYRSAHRERDQIDFDATSVADLGITPTKLIAAREEHQLLLAALRAIPLDDQIALELIYWERLTARELADVLDVPEGTARTRLRSARLSLEAKMAELARSPTTLRSTLDNLERWSESVREYLAH